VPSIELNGGKAISVQLHKPNYKIDWEEVKLKITAKTKMIIINSPHNPSGTLLSENDMQSLAKITSGTDIIVLSDEVYEHLIYDGEKHQSICLFPNLKDRSFITASFGKTFHNTGWKMGYCCGPRNLMDEFLKVHQFNVFSVNHPMQVAMAEYLEEPEVDENSKPEDVYLVASHRELRSHYFYTELAHLHADGDLREMLLKMANEELKHKEKMEYLYANTAFPQTSGG